MKFDELYEEIISETKIKVFNVNDATLRSRLEKLVDSHYGDSTKYTIEYAGGSETQEGTKPIITVKTAANSLLKRLKKSEDFDMCKIV
jgi:hypothetical protein